MGRNLLVDGKWQTDLEPYTDEAEAFDRTETSFCDWIRGTYRAAGDVAEEGPEPEAGRYHLYIARNCPWAHGAALTRRLAGLTDAVSMDIIDPIREDDGGGSSRLRRTVAQPTRSPAPTISARSTSKPTPSTRAV